MKQLKLIAVAGCTSDNIDAPSYVMIELDEAGIGQIEDLAYQAYHLRGLGVKHLAADATGKVKWLNTVTIANVAGAEIYDYGLQREIEEQQLEQGKAGEFDLCKLDIGSSEFLIDHRSIAVTVTDDGSNQIIFTGHIDFDDVPEFANLRRRFDDIETLGPSYVTSARSACDGETMQIDEEPRVTLIDNGAWVQAWMFISDHEAGFADIGNGNTHALAA